MASAPALGPHVHIVPSASPGPTCGTTPITASQGPKPSSMETHPHTAQRWDQGSQLPRRGCLRTLAPGPLTHATVLRKRGACITQLLASRP